MGLLSGNSCNIITLLPLGLDCDSINASTPDSTNGMVTLYITGGTPPYNVNWDNGSQGTLLTNLGPGDYTATVIDYYGDFSATTTCTVSFDSFYIEEFENCKDSSKIYYLADLPSIFSTGKTYELTTQVGCWLSSGTTLYTGQTYYNVFAEISSGPYDDCQDCLPQPEPEPEYPSVLCAQLFNNNPKVGQTLLNQETFLSANTINGYPSWSSSTQTIYYNTGNTRWEILNWPSGSNAIFVSPTPPPVGTWTLLGLNGYTLIVSSGACVTPLRIEVRQGNPTCSNTNDGTITIYANNGTAPYTYSIDGIQYQNSNIFTSLNAGVYTVYVLDNNGATASQTVTLTAQQVLQNYTINLTNGQTSTLQGFNSETKTRNVIINIVPTLPNNVTVSFDIPINVLITGTTNVSTSTSTTQENTITFNTFNTSTVSSPTITTPITTSNQQPSPCPKYNTNTTAYTETYQATITGNGYIECTITQKVITPPQPDGGCKLFAKIIDTVNLTNTQSNNMYCANLISNVTPLTYELYKESIFVQS
jgi:hypothetical protein